MTRNWEDLFQDGQWLTGRTVVQLKAMEADITTALAGGTVVTDGVTIDTNGSGAIEVKTAGVTDAQVAAANKDGVAATPSLRTLGTGATQAAAGNDSRLSDSRVPTGTAGGSLAGTYPNPTIATGAVTSTQIADGTIVDADISATAAIAKSKLGPLAIADGDVAAGAAIAKSKLAALAIVDADIAAGAAIALSKLASPVGLVKIWDSVDAGVTLPAASITTPTLPTTFKHLYTVYKARSSGAAVYLRMRVNGDSGASNYLHNYIYVNSSGGVSGIVSSGASSAIVGWCAPNTAAAGRFAAGDILIPGYTATDRKCGRFGGASGDGNYAGAGGWMYDVQAAIATLTFFADTGNLDTGIRITVYVEA